MDKVNLHRADGGEKLAGPLESARTLWQRTRGLIGRDALAPGCGMVIWDCNAVHTFFMRFPIDVVFVDSSVRVLKVAGRLAPYRFAGSLRASAAIELCPGAAEAAGIREGDALEIRPACLARQGDERR